MTSLSVVQPLYDMILPRLDTASFAPSCMLILAAFLLRVVNPVVSYLRFCAFSPSWCLPADSALLSPPLHHRFVNLIIPTSILALSLLTYNTLLLPAIISSLSGPPLLCDSIIHHNVAQLFRGNLPIIHHPLFPLITHPALC